MKKRLLVIAFQALIEGLRLGSASLSSCTAEWPFTSCHSMPWGLASPRVSTVAGLATCSSCRAVSSGSWRSAARWNWG
ncbi:hypothetical protein HDK77DRAFT_452780, partial [Phyllosticta capitalensis]|uniref:uncharacterized protein n=1 Tax=Phyllosticta capitalensis TaxID=121624 RepID=UPI00312D2F49